MIDFNKTLELASQNTQKKIQSNEILPTASKNSNILSTDNKKVQNMQNRVLKTAQYSAKQQALQKQKRKEDEEEAWNNLKTLENSYQEKEKWLLANQNQNNTVLGTVTDEYRKKQEEMQQANEAYKNALSNYYNEYREEYDQRLKESNQKTTEQFLETAKGIGSNIATGVTRGINSVGNFVKENAPALLSNKYYTQQEMADYEQKYGITESSKQEILEKYKNEYGTLEEALTAVTKEKSKLQQMHEDIGGQGILYDKESYEERERNIERLKYERDLISESLGKASVPDNVVEVGKSLLDVIGVGDFFDMFGGDLVQPLNQIGDAGEDGWGETADSYAEKSPEIAGLAQNVGSLIPAMVATAVSKNTAVGTAVFAAKAKNDYYHEYLDQGYTATEADNLSNIMTVVEVGSEYLGDIAGGVNILKKGSLKDWARKPLSQAIKGYVIEGGEEVLAEVAGMIVTDEKLTTEEFSDRVKSAFAGGVALSIVMNGVGKAGSTIAKCKEKLTNGQKLTMSEVEQVIQEQASIEGKSVEEIMNDYGDKVNELAQSSKVNTAENATLPTANQKATVAEVLPTASEQKTNNTESTMLPTAKDNVLPTANKQNVENVATKNNEITTNLQEEIGLSISNDNMLPYANSENLAVKKYQYVESDNTKINDIRKDASQYFTDSEQAHKFIETLEKVIVDKDLAIRLNANVRTEDNKIANGKYDSGTVTIDPSSPKALESIAIHEATHAIGTKSMLKIVDTYRKSDAEFNSNVQALLDNYNVTELNEEVLADVSSELFGTQEFINNVADAHPTLFQKIYSEIKYLWHQFRGYKTQGQFIEDLYFKWNQAYNSSNKLNSTTNYYIENVANYDEMEYNDLQEIRLPKREYAILSGIINSDSNISPGINYVDVTNGRYTVYYKEFDNFKVMSKEVDADAGRISQRNDSSGRERGYSETPKQVVENEGTTTSNDEISSINTKRTRERNGSNTGSGKDIRNGVKYSISVQTDSSGNKYVKIDTDQNIFAKLEKKDYNKMAKMYIQEYLIGKTQLSDNDSVIIDKKSANKYTNPGKKQQNFDEKMKLTPELKNVLEIAQKTSDSAPIKDTNKYKSWEYYKFNFELSGKNFEGTINIGVDSNGNKHFYEINKIKELDDISGTSLNRSSNSSINDSIAPQNSDVNTTTKYSIQESENNSGSFSSLVQDNKGRTLPKVKDGYTRLYRGLENEYNPNYDKTLLDNNNGYESWTDNYDLAKSYGENVYYIDVPTSEIKNSVINEDASSETYGDRNLIYLNDKPVGIKGKSGNEYMLYTDHDNYNDIVYNKVDVNETTSDIRYSKQSNNSWQKYLEENFRAKGTRTYAKDILFQTSNESKSPNDILVKKADSENSYTMNETKKSSETESKNIANNKLETGKWTAEKEKGDKQRKHYDSIIKSQYTSKKAKNIARELMGVDTYVPESNAGQLKVADKRIETAGADNELNSLLSRAVNGGAVKAEDIAVGERLIQYYSKIGDKAKLQDAIQATAMAGTTAGQTVQAMSLLNHQTPEGQAIWLQRSVDKMNSDLKKARGDNAEQFNLTQDMIEKIVNSENSQALENNLNDVYEELGQQVTKTTAQKIDAWRYFSMLSSPRTHVRNITGNTTMAGVQGVKNKVAGVIEGAVSKVNPEMERTHTVKLASKEVKTFAKADIENVADRLGLSENKYNPKTRLENNMRTFKSDAMEKTVGKAFELNNNLLEVEDGWGLKAGYVKALSEYMTANNLTPETITDKQLGKARNYAVQQAKEATFHQDSQLASLLNQLSNKNKFAKFAMDAILPFKKTPINVAKTGIEYSPVGLIKSAVLDTANLRKGNITVNQYIDNISKGLTGTGIALVGYALANCGVLKASGSDDENRESFEESRGSQNYSITIGDNTYSLDWLAPSGIPFFIGAECYELMQASKEKKTSSSDEDELYNQVVESATNILDSFANAMNPMTEMSMLSGLTSSLKSYDQGSSQMLASIGTNAVKSYVNQFVPTLLGQIAKTTDQYERSTTSTKTGVLPKAIDSTKNQIMSKIPGLRQQLPIKTDTWGNDVKQSENVLLRTLENSVLPWTRKELNSTAVDKELLNVYENTGESSVFPDSINKNITINKQKYSLTSEEYAKYKKQYGQTSYKLLNSLIKSSDYKKMSDSEKQFAIDKIYSYATEQVKVDYAKQNNLEYEQSTLSKVTNAIKEAKGDTSYYFEYLAQTQELDKDSEKLKILASSKADNKTKQVIYENSLGKEDKKYKVVKDAFTSNGLDITQYLEYKSQEFTSDKDDDGTVNGKTISGSKKQKVYNYIESMKATYTQKLILSALEYKPTSYSDKKLIINYVNSLNKTAKEKLEILEQFKGVTIYKNGTYSY